MVGGRIVGGSSGWVIAPGTYTEATGRIRWLTSPYLTRWCPYQRQDSIDGVFTTLDWSHTDAPVSRMPALIDEALM
jgi:hypothetical protein